ncbi:MAG: hypothetical protein U5L96_17545 [Owenweeksia sp.]|nr:hypothetical protein [Owenweeksia sp.]
MENIIASRKNPLQHQVLDQCIPTKWLGYYKGEAGKRLRMPESSTLYFLRFASDGYHKSPVFNNELANKHKISSSIHGARKNYFKHLVDYWNEDDLGFEKDKFPPEKTIYITLLQENGMHIATKAGYELAQPSDKNGFHHLWKASSEFLESSINERKTVAELTQKLATRPYKIKQGLIDFWIPTFLFIRRADFALYENGRFVPHLNDAVLYMMTKKSESTALRLLKFREYD